MNMNDILELSLNIGTKAKFNVKIFDDIEKEMTYVELGMFLIKNVESIEKVNIIKKKINREI